MISGVRSQSRRQVAHIPDSLFGAVAAGGRETVVYLGSAAAFRSGGRSAADVLLRGYGGRAGRSDTIHKNLQS